MKILVLKRLSLTLLVIGMMLAGSATLSAAETAPKSIVHVVTVKWKEGTTPEQIKAALAGVAALPAQYKGLTHVWIRSIKAQGDKTHAFVMEFADEAAFRAYTDSPAQKEWYKVYLPIRGESATFDITN